MTQTAINSLVGDFDGATIYVVETGNVEPYKSAQTIFPKTEFNYNKFLKIGGLYRDWETDRKSTRLNSSHSAKSRMPSSA